MYGRISVEWKFDGDSIIYNVEIPANTTATIKIGGQTKTLGSGKYTF